MVENGFLWGSGVEKREEEEGEDGRRQSICRIRGWNYPTIKYKNQGNDDVDYLGTVIFF